MQQIHKGQTTLWKITRQQCSVHIYSAIQQSSLWLAVCFVPPYIYTKKCNKQSLRNGFQTYKNSKIIA